MNPTISYGSVQMLKVTKVKEDINDLTFSVNNLNLVLWAGDFDGSNCMRLIAS